MAQRSPLEKPGGGGGRPAALRFVARALVASPPPNDGSTRAGTALMAGFTRGEPREGRLAAGARTLARARPSARPAGGKGVRTSTGSRAVRCHCMCRAPGTPPGRLRRRARHNAWLGRLRTAPGRRTAPG